MFKITRLSSILEYNCQLPNVLKVMSKLEELYLSITTYLNSSLTDLFEIPITLRKLQLELPTYQYHDYPNFDGLATFLNRFQYHLHYLSLIIINVPNKFSNFDKFQNLIRNFDHLISFQYNISTNYQPDKKIFQI
ncbi:unnamed protein product [Rotaria sp. Silwood2]|nr:unnamed protein product [Rotaria sp. Silwood2]CAF4462645.1 unnamed protein product [Rotaria sp. Silwood2]